MSVQQLVYAVDDEQSIREVYSYALTSAGFAVKCFCDGNAMFAALAEAQPDLFILDVMLDGMDGYEILSKLRASSATANTPVIMVSAKTEELDRVRGLNLGADDYLCKPFGVLELVARVKAKLRSSAHRCAVVAYKDIAMDDDKHLVTVGGEVTTFTPKQYELLHLLVANAGNVLSRDKLLDEVWGENYGETRTLDIHMAELRKLLSASEAQIVTFRGVGYSLQ